MNFILNKYQFWHIFPSFTIFFFQFPFCEAVDLTLWRNNAFSLANASPLSLSLDLEVLSANRLVFICVACLQLRLSLISTMTAVATQNIKQGIRRNGFMSRCETNKGKSKSCRQWQDGMSTRHTIWMELHDIFTFRHSFWGYFEVRCYCYTATERSLLRTMKIIHIPFTW